MLKYIPNSKIVTKENQKFVYKNIIDYFKGKK